MKALSYWAVCHQKTAMLFLVIIQAILGVCAFELGAELGMAGHALPPVLIYAGFGICMLASVFYPVRRSASRFWKWSFFRQKLMDFGLVFSLMVMMCTWANREVFRLDRIEEPALALQVALFEEPVPPAEYSFWQNVTRVGPRQAIQIKLQKQVVKRVWKKQENQKKPSKIWWIVLIMILGTVLSAIIACGLACNGMGAWAAVVLFSGIVIFIIGGLTWIQSRRAAYANLKGQSLSEYNVE